MRKTRKNMYTTLPYVTTYCIDVGGHVSFIFLMGGHVRRNIYYRMCMCR